VTCVVALKDAGAVWMGADSAGASGHFHATRADPKIYRVGTMVIGFTSSFRMGQLLGHRLVLPTHHPDIPVERWMSTEFIDAVRECLKAGGWAEKDKDKEAGGHFLAVYRGRIFELWDDYQVAERVEPYNAVGSGFDLPLGSLYTSEGLIAEPRDRVLKALEAASRFCTTVRAPFLIERCEA
jgi:ATP-dependent protease HslVU (ClpYQ) peptidase subunit